MKRKTPEEPLVFIQRVSRELRECREKLSKLEDEQRWRPMTEAPPTSDWYLLFAPNSGRLSPYDVRWLYSDRSNEETISLYYGSGVYWRPLPPAVPQETTP